MTSVIIPAHNESGVLRRTLDSLTTGQNGDGTRSCTIYVVANACTDSTAAVAAEYTDRGVVVIEIGVASKTAALQAGDDAAGEDFPRLYVDADVYVTPGTLAAVEDVLERGALAAAPRLEVNTQGRPLAVRWYYRDFLANPWMTDAPVGSGFYALSKEGRARFGRWPDILNDDGFVQHLFAREERATARGTFRIEAPRTTEALVGAKARVAVGNAELAHLQNSGALPPSRHVPLPGGLVRVGLRWLRHPLVSANAAVLRRRIGREAARRRQQSGQAREWSQDLTTR